jgi:hypothetical protein
MAAPRRPPWLLSAIPARRLTRNLFRCAAAWVAALTLWAAGCSRSAVYLPYDTEMINRRSMLVLDAVPQAPLPEALAQDLLARIETGLTTSPYAGPALSRAAFKRQFGANARLNHEYELLSDSLSTAGIGDWEQALRLGKATGKEMLVSFQVYHVPCPGCEGGDQVAAVGNMVHAPTGLLVWRATFLRGTNPAPAQLAADAEAVSGDLVRAFNDSLRPKYHRDRFRNLSRNATSQQQLKRESVVVEAPPPPPNPPRP